jgi:hypothetical protein
MEFKIRGRQNEEIRDCVRKSNRAGRFQIWLVGRLWTEASTDGGAASRATPLLNGSRIFWVKVVQHNLKRLTFLSLKYIFKQNAK